MTNEEILQKLGEEIHLRGFSPHTHEEYMLRAKSLMLYTNRPLEELTERYSSAYRLNQTPMHRLEDSRCAIKNPTDTFEYLHFFSFA